MPARDFAVPETKSYPIPDRYHAELALTALLRVAGRHGVTPEGKRTAKEVLAAVRRRFPVVYHGEETTVNKIIRKYRLL
jgi:hypothetical protein